MRNYQTSLFFALIIWFDIFLLTSCGTSNIGTPSKGLPTDQSLTELHTQIPLNYSIPVAASPVSTSFEKPIISITPSETPLQILDEQSAQQEIIRLMETNDDCSNNCFWGIEPKKTNFDDAIEKLLSIGGVGYELTADSNRYYYSTISGEKHNLKVEITLSESKGIVYQVSVGISGIHASDISGEDWLAFRPDRVMEANGVPQQVFVIMYEGPEGRISYDMAWMYDEMYIQYIGNQVIYKPEHILRACPLEDQNIQQVLINYGSYDKYQFTDWIDLTQLTSLTPTDFFDVITGNVNQACFDLDYYKLFPQQ